MASRPIDVVARTYADAGWTVIEPKHGFINDLIVARGSRLHFVQVTTGATVDQSRFNGEARNVFIQNAFSNAAIPVHAYVHTSRGAAVTFEDVNESRRLIINRKKQK